MSAEITRKWILRTREVDRSADRVLRISYEEFRELCAAFPDDHIYMLERDVTFMGLPLDIAEPEMSTPTL